jgi:hypothetical protein
MPQGPAAHPDTVGNDQDRLFDAWRHHAVSVTSGFEILQAERAGTATSRSSGRSANAAAGPPHRVEHSARSGSLSGLRVTLAGWAQEFRVGADGDRVTVDPGGPADAKTTGGVATRTGTWLRRLPAEVNADLRSSLRIMSPRGVARVSLAVLWGTLVPLLITSLGFS